MFGCLCGQLTRVGTRLTCQVKAERQVRLSWPRQPHPVRLPLPLCVGDFLALQTLTVGPRFSNVSKLHFLALYRAFLKELSLRQQLRHLGAG